MTRRDPPGELDDEFGQLRAAFLTIGDDRQRETFKAKLAEVASAWQQLAARPLPAEPAAGLDGWR